MRAPSEQVPSGRLWLQVGTSSCLSMTFADPHSSGRATAISSSIADGDLAGLDPLPGSQISCLSHAVPYGRLFNHGICCISSQDIHTAASAITQATGQDCAAGHCVLRLTCSGKCVSALPSRLLHTGKQFKECLYLSQHGAMHACPWCLMNLPACSHCCRISKQPVCSQLMQQQHALSCSESEQQACLALRSEGSAGLQHML